MESIVVRRELVQRGGRRRCTVSRNATRKNRRVCVSIWAEWARSTRLKREGEGEVATLVNWVNPWHRDIACVDARAKHLETGHACATGLQVRPGLSTGGRSMTRVKIFPLLLFPTLLARPTFPSTTDSIPGWKRYFRFFPRRGTIFLIFLWLKELEKSNERNWRSYSYLQRFSPSIPHFLASFPLNIRKFPREISLSLEFLYDLTVDAGFRSNRLSIKELAQFPSRTMEIEREAVRTNGIANVNSKRETIFSYFDTRVYIYIYTYEYKFSFLKRTPCTFTFFASNRTLWRECPKSVLK